MTEGEGEVITIILIHTSMANVASWIFLFCVTRLNRGNINFFPKIYGQWSFMINAMNHSLYPLLFNQVLRELLQRNINEKSTKHIEEMKVR